MNDNRREELDLPDRRKNTYEALANRLDAHIDRIEERLGHRLRGMLIAFALIGVTSTLALIGYGFAIREVQNQRLEVCETGNDRHDSTIAKLNEAALFDENSRKTEAGKAEVRRRRDVTIGLIDSIAPHVNCDDFVETGLKAYLP
jgi:hypothetical protein